MGRLLDILDDIPASMDSYKGRYEKNEINELIGVGERTQLHPPGRPDFLSDHALKPPGGPIEPDLVTYHHSDELLPLLQVAATEGLEALALLWWRLSRCQQVYLHDRFKACWAAAAAADLSRFSAPISTSTKGPCP